MKKAIRISLLALALVLMLSALAACSNHTHTWSEEWSADPTHHWHSATCEHDAGARLPVNGLAEHHFEEHRSEPTCTVSGKITRTCSVCGYKKEATLAATGHTYVEGKTALTVGENQSVSRVRYCDVCDAPTSSVIPGSVAVSTAEEAQAALDAVGENGRYIYLLPGNYGTLYLRATKDNSTRHPLTSWAGGSGYILHRELTGVTIVAAEGATVDAIVAVGQTHNANAANSHPLYPTEHLISAISLESIELVGITFSGNAAVAVDLCGNVAVDGLLLDGCTMKDAQKDSRLLYRSGKNSELKADDELHVMSAGLKNITVTNCTVDGAYQVMELRGTEGLTVKNNSFKNIAKHVLLLAADGTPYSASITVTDNTADTIAERFLRMADVAANAVITVTGNTVTGYTPADPADIDVIKITAAHADAAITTSGNTLPAGSTVTVERAE